MEAVDIAGRRHEESETSALIIGAGAAGLRPAIEPAANGVDCLLFGKRRHGDARTIWAADGSAALYHRSSSRKDGNTGDAAALASETGAALRDTEPVRFYPTGMVVPEEDSGMLVTEAVRGGADARLSNIDGERFMDAARPKSWSSTPATSWRGRTTRRYGPGAAPRTGR